MIKNDETIARKIWDIELSILSGFDSFCAQNDIRYFVDYGTLLGAVRHQGFIPWDDDIDISMLRSDYEKMQYLAMQKFIGDIFFQSTYTDSQVMQVTKIRDRRTTAIEYGTGWILLPLDIYRHFSDG